MKHEVHEKKIGLKKKSLPNPRAGGPSKLSAVFFNRRRVYNRLLRRRKVLNKKTIHIPTNI